MAEKGGRAVNRRERGNQSKEKKLGRAKGATIVRVDNEEKG